MSNRSDLREYDVISKEGYHLIEDERISEAIQFFSKAIRQDPHNSFHYLGRASARWHQGYKKQAIQDYDRAAENWVVFNEWQGRFKKAELFRELYRYNRIANALNELVGYKQAN